MWRKVVLIGLLLIPAVGEPSPSGGDWHAESLLGENADSYFVLRVARHNPGSYYMYSEMVSLEKVSKVGLHVVQSWVIHSTDYAMDLTTEVWGEKDAPVVPVDLAAIFREHRMQVAFPQANFSDLVVDSTGVRAEVCGYRGEVMHRDDLRRQAPDLGLGPRVIGIASTMERTGDLVFLSVASNSGADVGHSVDLLVVQGGILLRARDKVQRAIREASGGR